MSPSPLVRRLVLLSVACCALGLAAAWGATTRPPGQRALVSVAAVVAAALFGWRAGARLAQAQSPVVDLLRTITAGRYGQAIDTRVPDDLEPLIATANQMSATLASRIAALEQNTERLATVLGSMVEAVLAVDRQQRILLANDAARALLEFTAGEPLGRPLWEVVRVRGVQQAAVDALQSDLPLNAEFEIPGKLRRVVSLNGARLPGDPSPGVVLVLHDVTELRRLENLRQEFVANVSHELKTPLTAIKAYAETLLAGALADQENNALFVHRIEEQAERLHQLILDLLSLARIETGQEQFEAEPVEVEPLVSSCVASRAAAAEAQQIVVTLAAPEVPLTLHADREALRQILDNLIDNAIKYTPRGGRVTIRWRQDADGAQIEVEDTGIGIPAAAQSRIFERFFRVDRARSRELGGTGLGLSIVKHLTQALGGQVAVQSEVGRGSIFTVTLPVA